MTVPQKKEAPGDIMEAVIAKGDLSKLTPEERLRYYNETCRSLGLNPLTRPLEYIMLNNRLTLYARRDAADQLRKIHGISIEIISEETKDGLLTVHVRARDQSGRVDEDLGVVNFPDALRGDLRANAILKAVTKAKRRVTLSISGLGFLDETEVEDIPAAAKRPRAPAPNVMVAHDAQTGEIQEPAAAEKASKAADVDLASDIPDTPVGGEAADDDLAPDIPDTPVGGEAALSLEDMAREAAARGQDMFYLFYDARSADEKTRIRKIKPELQKLMRQAKAQTEEERSL
jgi:hypothetical protein